VEHRAEVHTAIESAQKDAQSMGMKYTEKQRELITAARYGDLEALKSLIARGDDVDCELKYGSSALLVSSSRGYLEMVEILCALGAKVNRRNHFGATAILEAAEKGHPEVVRTLVRYGADINFRHNKGSTALLQVTVLRDVRMMRLLLELGADPEIENFEGWSARSWAEAEANPALMEVFGIERPAPKEVVVPEVEESEAHPGRRSGKIVANETFWIALMRAAAGGDVAAVRRLAEDGVELNMQSPNGTTALIAAVKNGQAAAAFELIDLGADVNLMDVDGYDAITWALKKDQVLIVEGLKERGFEVPAATSSSAAQKPAALSKEG
jgi:serine/threonine-protein phosphatase 6 regulatory ankyrin repeat subunit B